MISYEEIQELSEEYQDELTEQLEKSSENGEEE